MKADKNEDITDIIYSTFVNQPIEIQLTGGRWIKNFYDGAGRLYKTSYSTGEYWEYLDGMVFKNGAFYQLSTPEGRANYQSGSWDYEYFLTDHLGNTRVAYKANGTALTKTSETAFDPWGVVLKDVGLVNAFQNKFEYQNKEKESTFNLRRISFGARTYNASIGRFDGVDFLADEREWLTSYNYVQNNPIVRLDPYGAFDDYALKDDGSVELTKKTDDKFDRLTASNGKEIKIDKPTSSSGSIISQLSKKDPDGFSIGQTSNATDARNVYNFMDANTTRGIEFSLTGTMQKGKANYSISTSHKLLSTNFDKINIKPLNLIFHIHNHDGPLDNGNVTSPSIEDVNISTRPLNSVGRSTSMLPRFFISLETGNMREFFHSNKNSENTNINIKTVDLKNIKKYDYFKKNR